MRSIHKSTPPNDPTAVVIERLRASGDAPRFIAPAGSAEEIPPPLRSTSRSSTPRRQVGRKVIGGGGR